MGMVDIDVRALSNLKEELQMNSFEFSTLKIVLRS